MKNQIILSSFSQLELRNEIVEAFKEAFGYTPTFEAMGGNIDSLSFSTGEKAQVHKKQVLSENYLTRGEVAKLLKISLPTLHRYTKNSILKSYRIGGKVRYKKDEVDNALKERNFGLSQKGGHHA